MLGKIIKNVIVQEHTTEQGDVVPVIKGQMDIQRIEKSLEHTIYGLYFHEFGEKMRAKKLKFIFGFLIHSNEKRENFKQFLKERFKLEPKKSEAIGSNPEVFYYQTVPADENGIILFKLVFYEGTEFYVSIIPEMFDSNDTFLGKLFNSEIPITLTLGDKKYNV